MSCNRLGFGGRIRGRQGAGLGVEGIGSVEGEVGGRIEGFSWLGIGHSEGFFLKEKSISLNFCLILSERLGTDRQREIGRDRER